MNIQYQENCINSSNFITDFVKSYNLGKGMGKSFLGIKREMNGIKIYKAVDK